MFKKGDTVQYIRVPTNDEWKPVGMVSVEFSIGTKLTVLSVGNYGISLRYNDKVRAYPSCCFELVQDTSSVRDVQRFGEYYVGCSIEYLKNSAKNDRITKGSLDVITALQLEREGNLRIFTAATDYADRSRGTWLTSAWVTVVGGTASSAGEHVTAQSNGSARPITSLNMTMKEYLEFTGNKLFEEKCDSDCEESITLYRKDRPKPLSTNAGDMSSALKSLPPIK